MKKIIGILILSLATCTVANAGDKWNKDGWDNDKHDRDGGSWFQGFDKDKGKGSVFGAPEIDPASAISGLTLLLGGLTVLRGRRTKK
jgi:hypothetical protein